MTDPQPPAKPDADRKPDRRRLLTAAAVAALILAVLAGWEAITQFAGRGPAPGPSPAVESQAELPVSAPAAIETATVPEPQTQVSAPEPVAETPVMPVVPVETAAEPPQSETPSAPEVFAQAPVPELPVEAPQTSPDPDIPAPTADLAVTDAKGKPSDRSTGAVVWSGSEYPALSSLYAGTITFASGGTATIVFNRSFIVSPSLTLDLTETADGPLQGLAAIADLRADGTPIAIDVGIERAVLTESGALDGSFQTLLDAPEIVLALLFENGDTGILTLAKPPGGALEAVLFPDRPAGSAPSTSSQGQ